MGGRGASASGRGRWWLAAGLTGVLVVAGGIVGVLLLGGDDPEGDGVPLSGLKDRLRHHESEFTEKALGYSSFLQFCKAADTEDVAELWWDDEHDGYLVAAL